MPGYRIQRGISRQLCRLRGQRLSILLYHRVLPEPDRLRPDEPSIAEFRWQMAVVSRLFVPLSLSGAIRRLESGTLPPNAVVVTFDDGYKDNASLAWPVMRSFGIPMTVFIACGFLNGGRMFNDSVIEVTRSLPAGPIDLGNLGLGRREVHTDQDRRALIDALLRQSKYADPARRAVLISRLEERAEQPLPDDLMMSDEDVVELQRAGVEIGAHTLNHPILSCLDEDQSRREIEGSKRYLERLTESTVTTFAYPNGIRDRDYADVHVRQAREAGFEAAVTTMRGVSTPTTPALELPRFTPWDRTPSRFGCRLLLNHLAGATDT